MSFNTNYILPGDDKNQIIEKSNYNFSQILANSVGLPGEMGIAGPTGIIGQVGKDGDQGSTGARANQWFFQNTPPYGNLPTNEWPLINYDVWVDTSPGSTGGPNRIYYYNDNYTLGIYPFWVDTNSNFIVDGPFTIIQGISGPGEVTENNAIVIQPTEAATGTFVFTDGSPTKAAANPNYAKVLVSTDASATASLPIFSFGKTFYSTSNLPSFYWNTTSTDYGINFSSEGGISFQSFATGSYGSTGGTTSITGGNQVNITSTTGTSISATGGITINSPSIGFSNGNIDLQEGQFSLSSMSSGIGLSGSTSDYALDISGVLVATQTGERTVLNYLNSSGSSNQNALSLSMAGSKIFQINSNPPIASTGGAPGFGTYPALVIGYTGSTGASGGTGANIVKGYQEVTSSASSISLFYGYSDFSNYIEINPSSDVIVVTPTATTPLSTTSRTNRIWLYFPNVFPALETNTATVFDIFMNSTTYCIGGISVVPNRYSPSEVYIPDGGTGANQGCRHVRITFFGSEFPASVQTPGNNFVKFAYVQTFVSGNSVTTPLIYEYSPNYSPPGGGPSVICSELYRQGFMPQIVMDADQKFGDMMIRLHPEVILGYHYWALPIVNLMKKSKLFSKIVWTIAKPWSYQMAYEMGEAKTENFIGKILMKFGVWFSRMIGKRILNKKITFRL